MRENIGRAVLLISGIGILASAVLHGVVNVPHLREDLVEIQVRGTLVAAVMLVLYFSVVAMFGCAGLVLSNVWRSFRGRLPEIGLLWIVAGIYAVYGLAGFSLVSRSAHMLGYSGMGILVAIGILCLRGAGSQVRRA